MSRYLPVPPNLEYLKKEAKELLDSQRSRHPDWKLADAQHTLAREYGFESWPQLRAHIDAMAPARAHSKGGGSPTLRCRRGIRRICSVARRCSSQSPGTR